MPTRDGLTNFGAYIGTWQATHQANPQAPGAYVLGVAAGRVEIRCSAAGFVIAEEIHLRDQTVTGLALRLALSEIPDDGRKIYDHTHHGCRALQYESATLARQLGADDRDGHVGFSFESDSLTYNSAAVTLIRIDVTDVLGSDSRPC
jgi:hypothetical protein